MAPGQVNRIGFANVVYFVVLLVIAAVAIFPFLWAVSTSLKIPQNVFTPQPRLMPSPFTFENYGNVVRYTNFLRNLLNTLVVVLATIGLTIIVSAHASYFLARFRIVGQRMVFFLLAIGVVMQSVAILVPLYLLSKAVGLYDTYLVLVLGFSGLLIPQTVWLFKGFVETIPPELEDSARVDGCSRIRAYYLITFPLLRPGLVAAAIAIFVWVWNDLMMAIMLTQSVSRQLIQLGLFGYFTITVGIPWGEAMAFLIMAVVPIFLIFLLTGSRVVKGLTAGSIKG